MDRDKKIGAITMTASVILIFAFLALSDGWYPEVDFFRLLMAALKVRMFKDEEAYDSYFIDTPTKYLVLLCLIGFGVGLLLYRGIIQLPNLRKDSGEQS
jgi:hypothetical protein